MDIQENRNKRVLLYRKCTVLRFQVDCRTSEPDEIFVLLKPKRTKLES